MQIIERHRHRFAPGYIQPGRDAAVAFSNIDLKFKNPYPFPVQIFGSVEGDVLVLSLVGPHPIPVIPQILSTVRQQQDYQTFRLGKAYGEAKVRNSGKVGCEVAVYRVTGEKRELVSLGTYPAMNRVVEYR
jgi:vancomycin resistance protein YoaR